MLIALDDDGAVKSLEPLDVIAGTISGSTADKLIGMVKKGGTFTSVLAAPTNASAFRNVEIETMQVQPSPAILVRMAEAVKAGRLVIPLGQKFSLADTSKTQHGRRERRVRETSAAKETSSCCATAQERFEELIFLRRNFE